MLLLLLLFLPFVCQLGRPRTESCVRAQVEEIRLASSASLGPAWLQPGTRNETRRHPVESYELAVRQPRLGSMDELDVVLAVWAGAKARKRSLKMMSASKSLEGQKSQTTRSGAGSGSGGANEKGPKQLQMELINLGRYRAPVGAREWQRRTEAQQRTPPPVMAAEESGQSYCLVPPPGSSTCPSISPTYSQLPIQTSK